MKQPVLIAILCCAAPMWAATVPHIEVVEGDGAINNISLHHAKEPVVRVVDQDGHPLPNLPVSFLLPDQGPSGSFTDGRAVITVMTDSDGKAVGRGLRPNNIAGQFHISVSVSYQGQAATASILQTNAEPAQAKSSSKTIIIIALIGGAAAAGAAVGLAGKKSSSSSSGQPPPSGVIITPGSPSFGKP